LWFYKKKKKKKKKIKKKKKKKKKTLQDYTGNDVTTIELDIVICNHHLQKLDTDSKIASYSRTIEKKKEGTKLDRNPVQVQV